MRCCTRTRTDSCLMNPCRWAAQERCIISLQTPVDVWFPTALITLCSNELLRKLNAHNTVSIATQKQQITMVTKSDYKLVQAAAMMHQQWKVGRWHTADVNRSTAPLAASRQLPSCTCRCWDVEQSSTASLSEWCHHSSTLCHAIAKHTIHA